MPGTFLVLGDIKCRHRIAFLRANPLLRRSRPVPGILAIVRRFQFVELNLPANRRRTQSLVCKIRMPLAYPKSSKSGANRFWVNGAFSGYLGSIVPSSALRLLEIAARRIKPIKASRSAANDFRDDNRR